MGQNSKADEKEELASAARVQLIDLSGLAVSPRLVDGEKQVLKVNGQEATFRDLVDVSLTAHDPNDQELRETGEKQERYSLVKRVWAADKVELSAKNVELIRKCAAKYLDVMSYGVLSDQLGK